jgi:hypothetical protein
MIRETCFEYKVWRWAFCSVYKFFVQFAFRSKWEIYSTYIEKYWICETTFWKSDLVPYSKDWLWMSVPDLRGISSISDLEITKYII